MLRKKLIASIICITAIGGVLIFSHLSNNGVSEEKKPAPQKEISQVKKPEIKPEEPARAEIKNSNGGGGVGTDYMAHPELLTEVEVDRILGDYSDGGKELKTGMTLQQLRYHCLERLQNNTDSEAALMASLKETLDANGSTFEEVGVISGWDKYYKPTPKPAEKPATKPATKPSTKPSQPKPETTTGGVSPGWENTTVIKPEDVTPSIPGAGTGHDPSIFDQY